MWLIIDHPMYQRLLLPLEESLLTDAENASSQDTNPEWRHICIFSQCLCRFSLFLGRYSTGSIGESLLSLGGSVNVCVCVFVLYFLPSLYRDQRWTLWTPEMVQSG